MNDESDVIWQYIDSLAGHRLSMISLTTLQLFYCVCYFAISISAIGGNGIVIFLIVNFRRMRTVTNVFILNLAIGDLLMSVLCIPFTFTANLLVYKWPFGDLMCRVVTYAQAVSVFISAYTMVAISIDRYIAIIYPFRPKMTHRHSYFIIAFIWFVALLTPLPVALVSRLIDKSTLESNQTTNVNDTTEMENYIDNIDVEFVCVEVWIHETQKFYYSLLLMVLQYMVPFLVLVYTYTRIAYVVWGKQTPGEADDGRDAKIAASKRKMIKMMITCVVTFTLCWLPFNIFIVIGDNYPNIYLNPNIEYVWFACHWLAMSHTSFNPIIYMWMNARFRSGFRYVFQHCLPCVKENIDHARDELNGGTIFKPSKQKRSTSRYYNCYSTYEMTTVQSVTVLPTTKTDLIVPENGAQGYSSVLCSKNIPLVHKKNSKKKTFENRKCKVIRSHSCSGDIDQTSIKTEQVSHNGSN